MKEELYESMYALEQTHWWFRARREIIFHVIRAYLPNRSTILDVGCGTGFVLEKLSTVYQTYGMDTSPTAVAYCHHKGLTQVERGSLEDLAFRGKKFSALGFFDVLEHLENDVEALQLSQNYLDCSGYILITVPAYQFLWSAHDEVHHHKRRYHLRQLHDLLIGVGYQPQLLTYFNTFLFLPIAITRIAGNLWQRHNSSDIYSTSATVNNLLYKIFSSERWIIPHIAFPFGVSILCIAQKAL